MISIAIDDGLAEIVLDAPKKLNSLDEEALTALDDAYRQAEDAGARAVLLRGEGKGFCAGRDISAVEPATDDALGYLQDRVTPVLRRMADFPAPTFAAVQGACLGVGLGLAIATDVVYVAETAKIGSPSPHWAPPWTPAGTPCSPSGWGPTARWTWSTPET